MSRIPNSKKVGLHDVTSADELKFIEEGDSVFPQDHPMRKIRSKFHPSPWQRLQLEEIFQQ